MPNNYTLPEPNIGWSRPVSPVQDSSKVELLSGLASLAMEGIKTGSRISLQGELQQAEQDYLMQPLQDNIQEEVSDLSDPQIKLIDKFSRDINKLKRASESTNNYAAYRTRAEAITKKYMSFFPGLSSEFKQIASSTLGFDTIGSTAADKAKAERDAASDAQQQLKTLTDYAVKEYHLPPDLATNPATQATFVLLQEAEREEDNVNRKMRMMENAQKVNKNTYMQPGVQKDYLTWQEKDMQRIMPLVESMLRDAGVPDLSEASIRSISSDKMDAIKTTLLNRKADAEAKIAGDLTFAPEPFRQSVINRSNTYYDGIINKLNLKSSLEFEQNKAQLTTYAILAGLDSVESKVMSTLFSIGAPVPPEIQTAVFTEYYTNLSKQTPSPEDIKAINENRATTETLLAKTNDYLARIADMETVEEIETTEKDFLTFQGNFLKALATNENNNPKVWDKFFTVWADPKNSGLIDKYKITSPEILETVQTGGDIYAKKAIKTVEDAVIKLNQEYTKEIRVPAGRSWKSTGEVLSPIIVGTDASGKITIEENPAYRAKFASQFETLPLQRQSTLTRKINDLKLKFLPAMNNAISAMANVSNTDTKTLADRYLQASFLQ